jgi:hypothetical protein
MTPIEGKAVITLNSLDVRLRHLADIRTSPRNVCFIAKGVPDGGVGFLDLRCLRRTAKYAHAFWLDRAATSDPYTCTALNALAHKGVRAGHRHVVDSRARYHVGRFRLGYALIHKLLLPLKAGALLRLSRHRRLHTAAVGDG